MSCICVVFKEIDHKYKSLKLNSVHCLSLVSLLSWLLAIVDSDTGIK